MIFLIAQTEFKRLFVSPLAWSLLATVQFILALLFLTMLDNFLNFQGQLAAIENAPGATDGIASPLFLWAGIIMLAIMPLLTMRLFSEEYQHGTLSLLMSSPVSITEMVLGKFLGLSLFILLMIGMISLMPMSLFLGTTLDWGKLVAGMLGLFLLLSSFAAAGLYLSTLSRQPIIAAMSSFGLLLFLTVIYISGNSQTTGSELFIYLSHFGHFLAFLEGVFDTADAAYYLLFISAFLILSIRRLDNLRLQR